MMDNSTMRRGKPCWYLNVGLLYFLSFFLNKLNYFAKPVKKNVGNIAINDSFYLLALVYKIIKVFVSSHPMYSKFYELFTEVNKLKFLIPKIHIIYILYVSESIK